MLNVVSVNDIYAIKLFMTVLVSIKRSKISQHFLSISAAFLITVQLLLIPLAHALSPTFPNQEYTGPFNWIDINKKIRISVGNPSIDIRSVDYTSDGNTLNASFVLSSPINIHNDTAMISFGVYFGMDPNDKTGVQGINYQSELKWQNGVWSQVLSQWFHSGQAMILELKKVSSTNLQHQSIVTLKTNLRVLGFPNEYRVLFYTQEKNKDGSRWIGDFTNWVYIPPPDFTIETVPNYTILRPGEARNVELIVKSNTDIESGVSLLVNNSIYDTDLRHAIIPNETMLPPKGIVTPFLHIRTLDNASAHPFTVPVVANISFPTPHSIFEIKSYGNSTLVVPGSLKSQNVIKQVNTSGTVLPPYTVSEIFNNFIISWVSGVSSLLLAVVIVIFGYYYGFTKFSRIKNTYKRRIEAAYNSSHTDKEESRRRLREIKMEIMEILDKGYLRPSDYRTLNNKIIGYLDRI